MGVILSRFRKKKSTLELLEGIERDIKSIEEYGHTTERRHKAIVGRLFLFSVGLYVLMAAFFYFFFFPASMYDQILYMIPLLVFPLIILSVKRLVSWWYRRKLSRNQEKLSDMKEQKKELLEEVMDKETYKVARQILEKFAPEQLRKPSAATTSTILARSGLDSGRFSNQLALSQRNVLPSTPTGTSGMELRRRPLGAQIVSSTGCLTPRPIGTAPVTPRAPPVSLIPVGQMITSESTSVITPDSEAATDSVGTATATAAASATAATSTATTSSAATDKPDVDSEDKDVDDNNDNNEADKDTSAGTEVADDRREKHMEEGPHLGGPTPVLKLTRPVLPRERSVMDRLVEYLVGDGINQRYALICRNCCSHNGMALKEEFEYLAFRCCYCFHWNPARKQRLQAPRLDNLPSSENTTTSSSPAESNTEEEEDDSLPKPKKTVSQDENDHKSELHERKASSSSDGIIPTNAESAESPSSTEAEFESLVPDSTAAIPSVGNVSARH